MNIVNRNEIFVVFGLLLRFTSAVLVGKCGECLPNSVACVDEVSFAICKDGKITNNLTKCPNGKVCTSERIICASSLAGFSPVCYENFCNTCAFSNGVFACIDETTYGFCYDSTEPDPSSIRYCPNDRVCSLDSPNICIRKSEGSMPSCIPDENGNESTTTQITTETTETTETTVTTEITETTESTKATDTTQTTDETTTSIATDSTPTQGISIDPNAFCSEQNKEGYFTAPDDFTCKEYIRCYLLSGEYLGDRYYCAGFFNPTSGRCQSTKPNGC